MPLLRRFRSLVPLLAATLLFALPSTASADVAGTFYSLGPDGGTIDALAVDPLDPATVYAGASFGGGAFKSTDGGENWTPLRNGIPEGQGYGVLCLAIDPQRHNTIYAGTSNFGIYKSTDGGASWSPASQGLGGPAVSVEVDSLAVDPRSPDTVFAGTDSGVFKSTNGGASWSRKLSGMPANTNGYSFALDTSHPQTIVYAAMGLNGVYRSADGGETWKAANQGLPDGGAARFLALSPQQPGAIYVAGAGVFKSTNGGASWKPVDNGLTNQVVNALTAHPAAAGVLWAGTANGIFRSDDGAASWKPAGLGGANVLALATEAHGALRYAGTAGRDGTAGSVFRSDDGGATWLRRPHGISALEISSLAVEATIPPVLWVGTHFSGLFRSGDGGTSWASVNTGAGSAIADVSVDPNHPGTAYVVAGSNFPLAVVKTVDSGRTWSPLSGLPGLVSSTTVDPRTGTVFAAAQAGLYRSLDGGATWLAAGGEIATTNLLKVVASPEAPGVLYAIGSSPPGPHLMPPPNARVFKSTDGGATWARSDSGLSGFTSVNRLVVVPGSPATLYGLCFTGFLVRSRDAGATWESIPSVLEAAAGLDLAAGADGTLFAATARAGVLSSRDGGASWQPLNGSPSTLDSGLLLLDPARPNRLYVGTGSIGVQAIDIAAPSVCPSGATSATALCLQGRRFQVEVTWSDFNGNTGAGQAVPGIDPTGSFWFFDPSNTELVVKVLDGRALNNHFWVFYASLTNVAYTLTVTDTTTGAVRVYKNPLGHFGSAGDTEAF